MNKIIHCPYCGASHYFERYAVSTCVYWTPIWKNGILQNADTNPNETTVYCHCCECSADFSYTKGVEEYDRYSMPL